MWRDLTFCGVCLGVEQEPICAKCGKPCDESNAFKNRLGRWFHNACVADHMSGLPEGSVRHLTQIRSGGDSLSLEDFVFCNVCDRPLKKHQCRNEVIERRDQHGRRYQEINLRCVQCGDYIIELTKSHRLMPLLVVYAGLVLMVDLTNSDSGLSWSGVIIGFCLPVGSGALALWWVISKSRRDCKAILYRWSAKHGVDSSTWPKPIKHWVDLYGNNAGNWPPPSS